MRALPAETMVPCNKASSCSSSRQETRAAIGLLHVEPEAPKSFISGELWTTLQVCSDLHWLLLSIFWDWLWLTVTSYNPLLSPPKLCQKNIITRYQIWCIKGSTYTTNWTHCLLAQPVQPQCNVAAQTTPLSGVSFSSTSSKAVPQMWSCPAWIPVPSAAQPLVISNYNAEPGYF